MDFGTVLDGSNQYRKWKYYTSVSSNQFYDNCTDWPQKDINHYKVKGSSYMLHHTVQNYNPFRSMTIKPFSSYIRFRDWNAPNVAKILNTTPKVPYVQCIISVPASQILTPFHSTTFRFTGHFETKVLRSIVLKIYMYFRKSRNDLEVLIARSIPCTCMPYHGGLNCCPFRSMISPSQNICNLSFSSLTAMLNIFFFTFNFKISEMDCDRKCRYTVNSWKES